MKIQVLGGVFLYLSSWALCGMQQTLFNAGQIQQNSLDSTSSSGSLPSIALPDPFGFDESTLSDVRIAPASRDKLLEQSRKPLYNNNQKHDQSGRDNSLQSPLLTQENSEPQTDSQMHNMFVKSGHEPLSVCRGWTLSKHVVAYVTLFMLGLAHGAVNKNLSGGGWNEHFWKAPWREWEIGAGANLLELFTAVLCYHCLQMKADLSPKQHNWLAVPLLMVMLGGGQAFGEVMPTPDSPGWRNCAVNMWVAPLGLWYLIVGIRSIGGYYTSKPLLNPADPGIYDSI